MRGAGSVTRETGMRQRIFENDIDGYVLEIIDLTQVAVKNYVLGSQSTTGVLAPKYPI